MLICHSTRSHIGNNSHFFLKLNLAHSKGNAARRTSSGKETTMDIIAMLTAIEKEEIAVFDDDSWSPSQNRFTYLRNFYSRAPEEPSRRESARNCISEDPVIRRIDLGLEISWRVIAVEQICMGTEKTQAAIVPALAALGTRVTVPFRSPAHRNRERQATSWLIWQLTIRGCDKNTEEW
jgi:hypothetical protein